MTQPLIGLTTGRHTSQDHVRVIGVSEAYVQALLDAGATPLLLPLPLSTEQLASIAPRLDGIVFTGGGDVHPERYGSQLHPQLSSVDPDRDQVEISLVQTSLQDGIPFLGICRGLQVINVALGGSLYEDLLDQRSGSLQHQHFDDQPRDYRAHGVRLEPGTHLAKILQTGEVPVNSLHHQGIRDLAKGLLPSAYAPDGLIEAFEIPGHPFALAVQWHPEWLRDDARMRALFQAFIQAAGQRRNHIP